VRILLAHVEGLMLAGMRQTLSDDDSFEVVGEVHAVADLAAAAEATRPEVVLLDAALPGGGGLAGLRCLRAAHPEIQVVMSSDSSDRDAVEAAFKLGACGYVVESINPTDLGSSIRQATAREVGYLLALPADEPFAGSESGILTARELEVIEAVSRGLSNKQIAGELWITVRTVKFHLTSIYRKLGIANRTQAARWVLDRDAARRDGGGTTG
jgi:DNA-binding NarL/FixJ family response regulator